MTIELELPLSAMEVRELTVGDQVSISGVIHTFRAGAQKHVHDGGDLPFETAGGLIYHCGPIGKKKGKKWSVQSAGPDLSSGIDAHHVDVFGRLGVRGIIGRGGLGPKSQEACRRYLACYLTTVGGAGLALASTIKEVREVHLRDLFPDTDAVWELEVEGFPAVVTIDCHGGNLHKIVRDVSARKYFNIQD